MLNKDRAPQPWRPRCLRDVSPSLADLGLKVHLCAPYYALILPYDTTSSGNNQEESSLFSIGFEQVYPRIILSEDKTRILP